MERNMNLAELLTVPFLEWAVKLTFLAFFISSTFSTSEVHKHEIDDCKDPLWCNIPMPNHSLYRFQTPPNDVARWEKARKMAATGEPVLLKRILKHFPHYYDFLEGHPTMRSYHSIGDYFIDNNHGFEVLNAEHPGYASTSNTDTKPRTDVFGKKYHLYDWENDTMPRVIPEPYNLKKLKRAPVVHVGYFASDRKGSSSASLYFGGKVLGEAVVDRNKFLRMWHHGKDNIDTPWIGVHYANENWGMFSTYFPNRTVNWGRCCASNEKHILELLNHPKTLMLLTNQHHNMTHPKLISLPLGVPINSVNSRRIIFDAMQFLGNFASKEKLIFTASSNWGYRPKILECLSKKFDANEAQFNTHKGNRMAGRVAPIEYYKRLGRSRFSVALPGLGYDTYRTWEILTLGTIPILEKGIGLDKTLWKLPALIVEDFDLVTPKLLHTAYVEAIYRADEFEFERITQQFWYSFIMNVSRSMSSEAIFAKFPIESEDPSFRRPFERFQCHETQSCGPETKKIPKSFC